MVAHVCPNYSIGIPPQCPDCGSTDRARNVPPAGLPWPITAGTSVNVRVRDDDALVLVFAGRQVHVNLRTAHALLNALEEGIDLIRDDVLDSPDGHDFT